MKIYETLTVGEDDISRRGALRSILIRLVKLATRPKFVRLDETLLLMKEGRDQPLDAVDISVSYLCRYFHHL